MGEHNFFFYLRLPSQLNYAGPLSLPNSIMPDPPSPPNWIMPDHLIQIRYNIPPPNRIKFLHPQLIFFVPLPIEFFFFQTDTKIVWVRNQYLPLQMLHNLNEEFVFPAKIYISNTQLYFAFNVMVCIVESVAFPPKRWQPPWN